MEVNKSKCPIPTDFSGIPNTDIEFSNLYTDIVPDGYSDEMNGYNGKSSTLISSPIGSDIYLNDPDPDASKYELPWH